MKRVLFYRRLLALRGGHLKVWDYYRHVRAHPGFEPAIYFEPGSHWDGRNPWRDLRDQVLDAWDPLDCDVLFMEGLDWHHVPEEVRRNPPHPVIGFLQHVRHGAEGDERREFLQYPAIRICVSQEVADAVNATGLVRGPVFAIPNAIDPSDFPPLPAKSVDVFVDGIKKPEIAKRLRRRLFWPGRKVDVLTERILREEYLDRVARARVAVFLPNATEGFFLPPLEAMALDTVVVCPDCVGNRGFCLPGENCFLPDLELKSVLDATRRALALDDAARDALLRAGHATVARHGPQEERRRVHEILDRIPELWEW
jgi:glycosyltransferase involved in cell wall biosynthesis